MDGRINGSVIGLCSYADDPHRRVFRVVYLSPGEPESVLDGPALETDPVTTTLRVMRKPDGTPYQWDEFGVNIARPRLMDKAASMAGRKKGAPETPATEPVVYFINFFSALALLSQANQNAFNTFIAVQSTWMNLIDLGDGDPAALLASVAPLISPSWVVVVDGAPSQGTLLRQRSVGGHTVGVWSV